MAFTEFTVRIRLGNAEMQTSEDIAAALEGVAAKVRDHVDMGPGDGGAVVDANGNSVGRFRQIRKGGKSRPYFDQAHSYVDPDIAQETIVRLAAALGGVAEWPGADMLESVAEILNRALPENRLSNDEDAVGNWGPVADELGYEHDLEDEEEGDDE